eukprot:3696797-Rhodomonas_salina.2
MGPRSSMGSPITLIMRPRSSGPAGTMMGAPVSTTGCPRTRPSVASIAMVRTVFSPRCCATSSTRRMGCSCTSSALRMAGSSPSNCTSTTAPMTCVIFPGATPPDIMRFCWKVGVARRARVAVAGEAAAHFAGKRAATLVKERRPGPLREKAATARLRACLHRNPRQCTRPHAPAQRLMLFSRDPATLHTLCSNGMDALVKL